MRRLKFLYVSVLQGRSALGWQDLAVSTQSDLDTDLRLYRDNDRRRGVSIKYRIIERRIARSIKAE